MKEERSILRDASLIGSATFLSRILGLVREQVFAFMFGAGNAMDAYQIAFRIPNLFRDLFAEGAMSAALVPTFSRVRESEGQARAWMLAGRVFKTLFFAVFFLALIGIWFAPELVNVYASAFHAIPGKFELSVRMTRVLYLFFPFVCLAAAFMAVLNASGVFFLPAFASALFNLSSIVCGVLLATLAPKLGIERIEGMAWGAVIGGFVQAFCQWPKLKAIGFGKTDLNEPSYRNDQALKQMLVLMVPGTLGLAATQINLLVNSVLATSEGPGAVSWLNYAFRLMQFPIGIFGVSLAVVAFSRISKQWALGDYESFRKTLSETLNQTLAINFPAAAGLAALSIPILWLLYGHGRFSEADTLETAKALSAYSLGLVAYSLVKVLVPVCYSMGESKIAVFSSLLSVCANLILNLIFVKALGFWGLALGTSLTAYLNCGFLIHSIRKRARLKGIASPFEGVLTVFLQCGGLAIAMGLICGGITYFWVKTWGLPASIWVRLVQVFLLIGLGTGSYTALAKLFRVKNAVDGVDFLLSKFRARWESFRHGR